MSSEFLARSNTNRTVHPQKRARGLIFGFKMFKDCNINVAGNRAADLCLCFHTCIKQVFS